MKITIYGKNIQVTDTLREVINKKVEKIEKYFYKDIEAKVVLSVEKMKQKIEITIPFNGTVIRAEESSDDMYTSIDKAIDILERQIRKFKTKLQKKYHDHKTIRFESVEPLEDDEEDLEVVRTKRFAVKPMAVEEAALQMNLINHNFYVFLNADTEQVNVVYKRKDNKVGLIEPEF